MDLSPLPISYRATIPESYLDEMGHMNVMWYTHLSDRATFYFFNSFGYDDQYFASHQAGCFALTAHYRYLAEVRAGQKVTMRTRALGLSTKRLHFMHFLTIDDLSDRLSATVETLATHTDMTVRRSSPLPDHLAEAYGRIVAQHALLPWEPPLCGAIKV